MELREKIAAVIVEALKDHGIDYGNCIGELAYADDILAIPEIRDALNGVRPVGGYWERTGTGKGARKWVPVP